MAGVNDNLIPAKPGEVRNPKGKPKGTIHLSTRIQRMLNDPEFTAELVNKDGSKVKFKGEPVEAIVKTAILKAMSGDKKWADWLAQNGYGSKQIHEFQGNPVEAILEKYGLTSTETKPTETSTDEGEKSEDAGQVTQT